MILIRICELDVAEHYIDNGYNGYLLSLMNTDMHWKPVHDRHFVMYFDDIPCSVENKCMPQEHHLRRILSFTDTIIDGEFLLLHCKAGISRSPAVAIAILIQKGMDYKEAFHYVFGIRDQMCPNQLLIEYTDNIFGLGGQLIAYHNAWKTQQKTLWIPRK